MTRYPNGTNERVGMGGAREVRVSSKEQAECSLFMLALCSQACMQGIPDSQGAGSSQNSEAV